MYLLNVVADLAIFAGYMLVPLTWLRYLPLTRSVRSAALVFFLSAALTRLSILAGTVDAWYMVIVHVIQAVGVVWFVLGFWLLLRRADRLRRTAQLHAAELRAAAARRAAYGEETGR